MAHLSFLERQRRRDDRRTYFVARDGLGFRRVDETEFRNLKADCILSCFYTVSDINSYRHYCQGQIR